MNGLRPICLAFLIICAATAAVAQGDMALLKDLTLPAPRVDRGKPLMVALKERQSIREFTEAKLPIQTLSDLLWAADGVNRTETGKRTAPSARNWQEIDVYVVMEDGAFLYDAKNNSLKMVARADLRRLTGMQDFVVKAPLNLVYVADSTRMVAKAEDAQLYMGADTGFIAQNVYLFCASEGLATVVRASVERKPLAEALRLTDHQTITLSQTVGYPAEAIEKK
jgi:SagB-type dehydrogenase family enzyme